MSKGISIELLFDHIAVKGGLIVSKPVFDVPYDRVVDNGFDFLSVQIKHTTTKRADRPNMYKFNIYTKVAGKKKNLKCYVDFVAVFIEPENTWYIIPADKLPPSKDMAIAIGGKWDRYKNNWGQLYEAKQKNKH